MTDHRVFGNTNPAPDSATYGGKEAVTLFWRDFFGASPQGHITVDEIFGLGMRWRYDWTDATGSKGHVRGVDILQARNGLICEKLSYVKG